MDPHVVLWLEVRDRGTQCHGFGNGGGEISDVKVGVHHALLPIDGRPPWRQVTLRLLKDGVDRTLRRCENGRAGFLVTDRPAEQRGVERRGPLRGRSRIFEALSVAAPCR